MLSRDKIRDVSARKAIDRADGRARSGIRMTGLPRLNAEGYFEPVNTNTARTEPEPARRGVNERVSATLTWWNQVHVAGMNRLGRLKAGFDTVGPEWFKAHREPQSTQVDIPVSKQLPEAMRLRNNGYSRENPIQAPMVLAGVGEGFYIIRHLIQSARDCADVHCSDKAWGQGEYCQTCANRRRQRH